MLLMTGELFLGKAFDPATEALGEPFRLDPDDLTTHGLVVGMTGSGKTGLSTVIIEELLGAGIPVIAIDPKGDLVNLALAFDRLAPEQFAPWLENTSEPEPPEVVAGRWQKGLADWGIDQAAVAAYVANHGVRILTPGSESGEPLNVLNSLSAPAELDLANSEAVNEEIDSIVSGLLGFIDIEADPVSSREYILLFTIIENAWKAGDALDLVTLVGLVSTPPIEKVGALPLEMFYPQKDRMALMMRLNNLVASPPFEAWRTGSDIDFGAWTSPAAGKTPLTIVYTAHLDDRERMFVTTLLLTRLITWMRNQPGRDSLRCLLYMDEVFGYFPPVAEPPSKRPLLTLLKQARAYGIGVLLATQNPVDVDYKGLANMGFWAIGRLQTPQDQARVASGIREALEASGGDDLEALISNARKRVFLIHDVHRKAPELINSRWAISYLRGPLTRDEIRRLRESGVTMAATAAPGPSQSPAGPSPAVAPNATPLPSNAAPAPAAPISIAPAAAGVRAQYANLNGGTNASAYVWLKLKAAYKLGRTGNSFSRDLSFALPISNLDATGELFEGTQLDLQDSAFSAPTPDGLQYADLPASVMKDGLKAFDSVIRERLDEFLAIDVFYDPVSKTYGDFGEDDTALALRIPRVASERKKRDTIESRLARKRSDLAIKSQEISGRRMEKWASIGTSILSNINIFTGRKRTVTGVGGVLSKNRMEQSARDRKERLEAEVAELEQQLAELDDVDPNRFETRTLKPARADISELRRELVWVY